MIKYIYYKAICTHRWGNNPTKDEHTSSNGFIISDRYNKSMAFYNAAVAEAKKDFPFLKNADIEPFVVTKSICIQGFPGIRFKLPENTVKEGYGNVSEIDFQYS